MTSRRDDAEDTPFGPPGIFGRAVSQHLCDIIIPTRNRPEPLQRCLRSLAGQSFREFGIVVVDDHSDEPLEAAVAEVVATADFAITPTVLRMSTPSGPSAARNAGVAASQARYVIFLDDDIVADRHLVAIHLSEVRLAEDADVPIVTRGPFVEPPDWSPTAWNLWEARMATRGTNALVRGDYTMTWRQFHTGNNCMPTDLFRAVGGFDESFKRLEDDEFGLRIHEEGCEFRFLPSALAWHYSNRTLEAWLAIPRGYAHYTVLMDRRYPDSGYLATRKRELARSNVLIRMVRAAAGGPRRTRLGVGIATGVGRASHKLGLTPITMAAFSLAFDLTYCESMRETEASDVQPPPRHG
jgi:glycosyltransferase involved in cell wall biosynthesis